MARAIPAELDKETRAAGYVVGFKPMRRVRGWPEPAPRPYRLYFRVGTVWRFIAAYSSAQKLESAWRKRLAEVTSD